MQRRDLGRNADYTIGSHKQKPNFVTSSIGSISTLRRTTLALPHPTPASAHWGQHSSATLPCIYSPLQGLSAGGIDIYMLFNIFSYILLGNFQALVHRPFEKGVYQQEIRKARLLTRFKSSCRLLLWASQHPHSVTPVHMVVARPVSH